MENKFDINSEEVKRILSLHEDATKNQYLNVISEQQSISPLIPGYVQPTNQPKQENKVIPTTYTTKMNVTLDNGYIIPQGTTFNVTKKGILSAQVPGTTGGVKHFNEDRVNVNFYCQQGKYFFDKGVSRTGRYDDGSLSKNLSKYCGFEPQPKQRLKATGPSELPKKEKPVVKQQKTQPNIRQTQQQFVQQVTTNNKLIQTSLGVQQPTGQLTTADIDAIITKLG